MLKASFTVKGLLIRLQNRNRPNPFKSLSSYIAPTTLVSERNLDTVLRNWPGQYRLDINHVIREVSEDEGYAAEANHRYIVGTFDVLTADLEKNSWKLFVYGYLWF
jgi:hypothetical protein